MVSSSQKTLVEISNLKNSQILSPIASSQDLGWESIIVEEFEQPPGVVESETHLANKLDCEVAEWHADKLLDIGSAKISLIKNKLNPMSRESNAIAHLQQPGLVFPHLLLRIS